MLCSGLSPGITCLCQGEAIDVVDHEVGYELRSADPTPFDMSYCRSLGHFSLQLLLDPDAPNGVMTTLVNGNLGLGLTVGPHCMKMAIAKAKQYGVGLVVAKNSTHYGIAVAITLAII